MLCRQVRGRLAPLPHPRPHHASQAHGAIPLPSWPPASVADNRKRENRVAREANVGAKEGSRVESCSPHGGEYRRSAAAWLVVSDRSSAKLRGSGRGSCAVVYFAGMTTTLDSACTETTHRQSPDRTLLVHDSFLWLLLFVVEDHSKLFVDSAQGGLGGRREIFDSGGLSRHAALRPPEYWPQGPTRPIAVPASLPKIWKTTRGKKITCMHSPSLAGRYNRTAARGVKLSALLRSFEPPFGPALRHHPIPIRAIVGSSHAPPPCIARCWSRPNTGWI